MLVFLLSACSESIIQQWPVDSEGEVGSVKIELSQTMDNEEITTRAENVVEPDLDEFRVAIYAGDTKMRLYNDSYANTKGKTIKLNSKEHRLVAQHGDSLGYGFNKPYYLADKTFTVVKGENRVDAEAKLSNVKIAVVYDATISDNHSDYYVVVKHNTFKGKSVKFTKSETRCAYMPGGDFSLEVYAMIDGEWKVYSTQAGSYAPNDFVTFTITTDASEGGLRVNINVDTTTEDKSETIYIPSYTQPQEAPSIMLAGFDGTGNVHEFIEGVSAGNNATASFLARASIVQCILSIDSEFLEDLGVPAEVDFANLSTDLSATLKAAGFVWDEDMKTSRTFSYIDFSGVIAKMYANTKAKAEDVNMAKFNLKVVDGEEDIALGSFNIVSGGVKPVIDVKDYNVWAKKIVEPVVTINKGNVSLVKLQYSFDGKSWSDFNVKPSQNSYVLTYDSVPVNAGTVYKLRAIYNDNSECASTVVDVRTEDAAQLGNSGFEDYQLVKTDFTPMGGAFGGGTYTRNWYLPYASGESDPWWACNSMQSMPDGHTGWSVTWCKNFPSSGYVTDCHGGSKAAMIYCVNVGGDNTANSMGASSQIYEGEIWIGTADGNGNIASQGHAFASRPSQLTFYYKYSPNDGRNFYIDAWIKDADGNNIATASVTNGPAASSWTKYVLPFNYTSLTKKAAKIYVRISSSYGDGAVSTGADFSLGAENVTAHAGCFLKLDDFELVYE